MLFLYVCCDFEVCSVLPVMRRMIQRSELRRWRNNLRLLSDGKRSRWEVVLECGRTVVSCVARVAFRMAAGISQSVQSLRIRVSELRGVCVGLSSGSPPRAAKPAEVTALPLVGR